MRVANETSDWREFVNRQPEWRESYNAKSLSDYIDTVVAHYDELGDLLDLNNPETWQQVLIEVNSLMDAQFDKFGEIGMIKVLGNGMYLPDQSDELKFLDGSHGVCGEYAGFSIGMLPRYQQLVYDHKNPSVLSPALCIELGNYREYSDNNIALETNGDSVSIPIVNQDICFIRAD